MAPINLRRINSLCEDRQLVLAQLRIWKLIPEEGAYVCLKCGGMLSLCDDITRSDGWRWKCKNVIVKKKRQKAEMCGATVEFRHGTFFARSHLSLSTILGFANLWVANASLTLICEQLEMSMHCAVDWSSFCREVVLAALIEKKEPLGGPDCIVEIDESKFGKRKYHRGHHVEGCWVFGAYERGSGRVCMVVVEDRGTETLLPLIQEMIKPGTTIISDYWRAYDCLEREGYKHLKVNHSLNFKDPETGAHTNSIESSWRAAKSVTCPSGRKKAHVPGNLAKYMFQKRCAALKLNRTEEFLRMAGELYDPCKSGVECMLKECEFDTEGFDSEEDDCDV